MERPEPYQLVVELARGKINQIRGQAADWQTGGLILTPALRERIHQVSIAFGHAVLGLVADADLDDRLAGCCSVVPAHRHVIRVHDEGRR